MITGTLQKNDPAEMYHGIAFSRDLSLKLDDGTLLQIHDPDAIANDLRKGERYALLVAADERTDEGPFIGVVQPYLHTTYAVENSELLDKYALAVYTPYGAVLIAEGDVAERATIGTTGLILVAIGVSD